MDVDYDDIRELKGLQAELDEAHISLRDFVTELASAQSSVLKLKAQVDIHKDAKKDIEEKIRIKKLEINTKPRG